MPVTIGSNIASLQIQRRLSETAYSLASTFEKLSSGQRINRAVDDAAGLSISEVLRSNVRVFNQGIRNLNDGISFTNIADGAIEQLSNIMIRLKELSEQSANGTFGNRQRESIDREAQALADEYLRIARSTSANGVKLFDGSFSTLRLQAGYGIEGSVASGLGGAKGTGAFTAGANLAYGGRAVYDLVTGDFNGDGIADIAAGCYGDGGAYTNFINVRLGNADGSFTTVGSFVVGTSAAGIILKTEDLNNDGILDLAGAANNGVSDFQFTFLGNGDGTFGAMKSLSIINARFEAEFYDLNGDGYLDYIGAGALAGAGAAIVGLGRGDGTFSTVVSYATETVASMDLAIGDVNGDGKLDIVTCGYNATDGYTTVRLGRGDGTFAGATSYLTDTGGNTSSVVLGDVNGDGVTDIVSAGYDAGGTVYSTVRRGTGNGNFAAAVSAIGFGARAYDLVLDDLNGDGFDDLAWTGRTAANDGIVSIKLAAGNGSFGTITTYAAQSNTGWTLDVADVDQDGVLDLVSGGTSDANDGFVDIFRAVTTDGVSALLNFGLRTIGDARQALPLFDQKIAQLSKQRGTIGAFQSRLLVASAVLLSSSEQAAAADSRIRDTDIAAESANLTRLGILQQVASSVLAQANLQPRLAISLLE